MQNNDPFFAPVVEAGEREPLEAGTYNGVCIGVTIKPMPDYNDRSQMVNKVQFVFMITEGGQQYFLRTKPAKLVITDKSNLYLLVNSWTKASLERIKEGFSCGKMIGFGAQIVVTTKETNGKIYADIANVLPLKKGVKVPVTPAEIPEFLARNCTQQAWAEGITIKAPAAKPAFVPPVTAVPVPVATTQVNAGDFLGQSPMQQACGTNVAPSECAVAPFPTAQEVASTPASQPSAYVAPQPKQTYVPPAAPAPQPTWPAPQNPVIEVDDSDSLPF